MKALVTGATGFVGSHLVDRLLAEGLEVVSMTRSTSNRKWIESLPVEVREATLDDSDALSAAVKDVDFVFHVAGLTKGRSSDEYHSVNVEGTQRLLDAAVRAGSVNQRFLFVSSLTAVGPNHGVEPSDETTEPHPVDNYGESKLAAEQCVLGNASRLPVTIVRPPAVYGPRDRSFLTLFRVAKRFHVLPSIGPSAQELSFVHVTDLVDGIWLAATTPTAVGRTYFVSGGIHTRKKVMDAISNALDMRLLRVRLPSLAAKVVGELGQFVWALTGKPQIVSRRKIRDMLRPRWTCSCERARAELGFEPNVDLQSGMRDTARWYRDNGWL